jgi:hypothetical protein
MISASRPRADIRALMSTHLDRGNRKGKYASPVHVLRLTEQREITPYVWVHPEEERY